MSNLLYIEASPRKERSYSIAVAKEFLQAYRAAHPNEVIETIDLWNYALPEFNGYVINAKYRILAGQEHTEEEAAAWQAVVDVCNQFSSADKYLLSLPMWNFSIPYKLKHYLDVLVQPGLTFSYSPQTGYKGLLEGKKAAVIYARGGEYDADVTKALDMQTSYIELILGFIGIKEIHSIKVDPTTAPGERFSQRFEAAKRQACELAVNF
ncbi:MAG: NAD(P)H-dependent oxidoreductase [Acidobacteriota bacterium]|nr:NAD(P)H-dependent oxidoreductase [Blastocatellia bacterium]MDW8411657.1 NAD(P)H-dependent oxidoreductase [Acidobacteriota bacterium]